MGSLTAGNQRLKIDFFFAVGGSIFVVNSPDFFR